MNSIRGKIIYSEATRFGEIQILDTWLHSRRVRYLLVDGWQESAMYLEPALSDRLIFPYMRKLSWPISLRPSLRASSGRILLLGGGGFVWPRHVLNDNPKLSMTVAELSPEIVRISRDFFGLGELEQQYGRHLTTLVGDGFELLSQTGSFDLIVNDAFVGSRRAGRDLSDTILVHDHLTPDGIYAVNVTSAVKGIRSIHLNLFLSTLSRVFRNTDALIAEPERSPYESQNILVIASDGPLSSL